MLGSVVFIVTIEALDRSPMDPTEIDGSTPAQGVPLLQHSSIFATLRLEVRN